MNWRPKTVFSLFILLLLSSCSLAPFAPNQSARSLGAGNSSVQMGSANANTYIQASAGLSDNIDLGYTMEFGDLFTTSGLFTKYSFINNDTGPSLALEAGWGALDTASHSYIGPIFSLAFNESVEFFISARYNWATTEEQDLEVGDKIGRLEVEKNNFSYILAHSGINLWASENIGISLFASYGIGEEITWHEGPAMGAALIFRP